MTRRPQPDSRTHVLRLAPHGSAEPAAACERLRRLITDGARVVACDARGLPANLDTVPGLIRLQLIARRAGGELRLVRASRPLRTALELCGLAELFAIGCIPTASPARAPRRTDVTVHPTAEQVQALASSADSGPVVMVNLLRFKPYADGIDEGITGAEAYARYSQAAEPFLRGVGGRLLSAVAPRESVIGPPELEWDLVLLVQYPSRAKFLEMATDPEYLKIHAHREAALADSRLIACSELTGALVGAATAPSD
jgi:uncharacterized protein (DUF1330 family)